MWNDFTKHYTNVLHASSKITLEVCLSVHYRFQNISITSACLQNNNKRSTIQAPKIRRRHRQRERETTPFVFLGFLCSFLLRGTVPPPSAGILPPPTPGSPRAPASSARKKRKTVRGIALLWPGRELSLPYDEDYFLSSREPPTSFVRRVFPGGGGGGDGGVPSEKAMRAETKMEAPIFFSPLRQQLPRRAFALLTDPSDEVILPSRFWILNTSSSTFILLGRGFCFLRNQKTSEKTGRRKIATFSFPIGAL